MLLLYFHVVVCDARTKQHCWHIRITNRSLKFNFVFKVPTPAVRQPFMYDTVMSLPYLHLHLVRFTYAYTCRHSDTLSCTPTYEEWSLIGFMKL